MAFLILLEIIQGGKSCLPTFGHLLMLLSGVPEPKLVVISSLALKWRVFKVEALIFPLFHLIKRVKNQCFKFEDTSFQG